MVYYIAGILSVSRMVLEYVEYMLEKDNGEVSEDVGLKGLLHSIYLICPLTSFHEEQFIYDWSKCQRRTHGKIIHPLSVIKQQNIVRQFVIFVSFNYTL